MLVRLLTDRVVGYGTLQLEGSVIDVPDQEAIRLLERGQAEFLELECATVAAPENAIQHTPKPRRK